MNYKKVILPAFAILIAFLFLMAPIGAASHSISPATTSTNYQPNPTLNVNTTWNTYYSAWNANPLEYAVNSTANATLPANLSSFYQNPISVNPGDIIAPGILQNNAVGGVYWNTSTVLGPGGTTLTGYNVTFSTYNITTNGVTEKQEEADIIGATTGNNVGQGITVKAANYPSQNPAYDYLTIIISASTTGGANAQIDIVNSTGKQIQIGTSITAGTEYLSINLQQIEDKYHIGLNTTAGTGYSSQIQVLDHITVPSGAPVSKDYTTLTGLAMSTSPYILGYNSTGSAITSGIGNIEMAKFSPQNFKYTEIANGGYSVAVSQPLQNVTQTQTPITSGNYIEQVGYQGSFLLPSAPDLSYGPANVTVNLAVPASQFQVLDINGASYLSTLGNKTNGTVVLLTSTNPTTQISYLAYVDYTASQWQSISHPAGIFTFDGISYYFFIAIGAVAAIIGLTVAAKRSNIKAKQEEKVDHVTTRRGR